MKRFFPGRVRAGRTQAEPSPPFQALLPRGWDATSPPPTHSAPPVATGCNCDNLPHPSRTCNCSAQPRERKSDAKKSRNRSFASWFGAEKSVGIKQSGSRSRLNDSAADSLVEDNYYSRRGGGDAGQCPQRFFDLEQGGGKLEDVGSATTRKEVTVRRKLVFPGRAVMKSFRSRAMEPAEQLTTFPTSRNGSPDENREPVGGAGTQPKPVRKAPPRREVLGVLEERKGERALLRSKSTLELALESAIGARSVQEHELLRLQNAAGGSEPGRIKRPGTLKRVASPVAIQSPGGKYLKRLNDGVDTPVLILSAHSHGLPKFRTRCEVGRRQSTGSAEGLVPGLSQLSIGVGEGVFDPPKDSPPIWKRRRVSCPRSIAVPLPPPPIYVS